MDQFTGEFLFLRKPALEGARAAADSDRQSKTAEIETTIRDRLTPNTQHAGEMFRRQAALAQLLLDHYSLLLNSTGRNYASLVRHAYTSRAGYESFLRKLAAAENEIDRIILAIRGGSAELQAQTALKQKAAHTLRTREAQDIFKK